MTFPLTTRLATLVALSASACIVDDDDASLTDDDQLGQHESAVESYFCVDHPCADVVVHNLGYCPRSGSYLLAGIDNVGTARSGVSRSRFYVDYYGYSQTYDTPSIAVGGSYVFWISLPTGCLQAPGCTWGIIADATNIVTEISGTNNTRKGACI